MSRSSVAILRPSPATVCRESHELLNLARCPGVLRTHVDHTVLGVNVWRHFFFPGSSTSRWQLERRILGSCIREAPKFSRRRRRRQAPQKAA